MISIITPTHNPQWLADCWKSVQAQTFKDWEWKVFANGAVTLEQIKTIVGDDSRVFIFKSSRSGGIGAIKAEAFAHGNGSILVELDHDDLLTPDALEEIEVAAHNNPQAGFFYSDTADLPSQAFKKQVWEPSGWRFYDHPTLGLVPHQFKPSAVAMASILFAPNHVRAWRRTVYEKIGGHDPRLDVCDDHELLVRTYLETEMVHITKALYQQRIHPGNTWPTRQAAIDAKTREIGNTNLEKLILREAELRSLPVYDLGAAISPRAGWKTVDVRGDVNMYADLRKRWPFKDNSVMAFRAQDFLEHLPDKLHTMSEIHRCLVPGGWLLSSTPSTDGRGAFMDPTHVSYWNSPAFWYWTKKEQAEYIENEIVRFSMVRVEDHFPSDWHKLHNIPYVTANLIAIKPGYDGPRSP